MDIKEATQKWVRGFNAIPQELIKKAYFNEYYDESFIEITPKTYECNVCGEQYTKKEAEEMEYVCKCSMLSFEDWLEKTKGYENYYEFKKDMQENGFDRDEIIDEWEEIRDEYCEYYSNDLYEVEKYDVLPMWGTMWTFEKFIDKNWAREHLESIASCGFRIYESDELGIILGIDGAGYDFYEAHWIPLYKCRGLRWHDTE